MSQPSAHAGFASTLLAGLLCMSTPTHSNPVDITLGSGRLGRGAIGLFSFSLGADQQGNDSLTLDTAGSTFDTEIALYDAQGRMVATNDNITARNRLSRLGFSGTQALAAGDYFAIISGFNTVFRDGDIVPGTGLGGDFRLSLQTARPVSTSALQSHLAQDGNILPGAIRETAIAQGTLATRSVERFDFTLANDIAYGDWFVIHTNGSEVDTEIGLYDAFGKLVATNDNVVARNPSSRLSFGLDGDNGRSLPAGAYSVLVGGFNTIFRDGWSTTSSFAQPASYAVYLQSSRAITWVATANPATTLAVPEPSSALMTLLGLAILFGARWQSANAASTGSPRSFISANSCIRIETFCPSNRAHRSARLHMNQQLA